MIYGDTPIYGLVCRWLGGLIGGSMDGSGQVTKNQINLELIEIIQFYLKIYDLWRHPHLWVDVWVDGWDNGWLMSDH